MSDNIRRRTDERDIGFAHVAADEWPYMRFKEPVEIRALMVIGEMPVIVLRMKDVMLWYGFYKSQWYTDFESVEEGADLDAATERLLEKAEELYENDLKEPEGATVETETEPSQEGK